MCLYLEAFGVVLVLNHVFATLLFSSPDVDRHQVDQAAPHRGERPALCDEYEEKNGGNESKVLYITDEEVNQCVIEVD